MARMAELHAEAERFGIDTTDPDAIDMTLSALAVEQGIIRRPA